jgi:hypothetical protein
MATVSSLAPQIGRKACEVLAIPWAPSIAAAASRSVPGLCYPRSRACHSGGSLPRRSKSSSTPSSGRRIRARPALLGFFPFGVVG